MDKASIIAEDSWIFATGVFLQPVECTINGMRQWRWVTVSFEEDSYFNGGYINPVEYAATLDGLVEELDEG